MLEFVTALGYASTCSSVVPLIFLFRKGVHQKYLLWLLIMLLFSLATDLCSRAVLVFHLSDSTTYLINFYNSIQFILVLLIYYELFLKEKRMIVIFAFIGYAAFEIINSVFFQGLNENQTWSWALSSLIFICLSFAYFERLLRTSAPIDIKKHAPGLINMAVFFYFSFSLYLFGMAEFVFKTNPVEDAIIFWGFHNFNNILKNLFFAAGIFYGEQKRLDH